LSFSNGKVDIFESADRVVNDTSLWKWTTVQEYATTLLILGVFVTFMALEVHGIMLKDGYAPDGISNLVTASFFGAVGLVVAGTLQSDRETNEQALQQAKDSEALQMATAALCASYTPIAIANPQRRLILCNPAFGRLTGLHGNTSVSGLYLEDVLCLSDDDSALLRACFQESSVQEAEFFVRGQIVHVKISPSSTDAESFDGRHGFVIMLKDVTQERALERAIENADRQAFITQAIMNALAAVSQRVQPQDQLQPNVHQNAAVPVVIPDDADD
jgi:PAS domain S-box-containing protein